MLYAPSPKVPPPAQSRRRKRGVAAGSAACLALFGMGMLAYRAVYGDGRLHEIARVVYRHAKATHLQRVLAAQVRLERADAPLVIFEDGLAEGWQDWSWALRDLAATAPVHEGKRAIKLTPAGYRGLYLHHSGLGTDGYGALETFINGDASTLNVCVAGEDGKFRPAVPLGKYARAGGEAPGWARAVIPLADLGVDRPGGRITGIVFQAGGAEARPDVFLDSVSLQPDPSLPAALTTAVIAVAVNVNAGRHPISPLIYGMAFAPPDYVRDLRLGLNRWGGNDKSRYNWEQGNACNAARDWRWANRKAVDSPDVPPGPGGAADRFVRQNQGAGAETLLTVPTLGWVARDENNANTSENVPPAGGAPLTTAEGAITGYDPAANRAKTSVRSVARKAAPFAAAPALDDNVVYQDEWVHHLVTTFGSAAKRGVRLYAMDNEPDLWDGTHTDVHPARMGYDDLRDNFLQYAAAVKDADPTALVTGPVSWGWTGYQYSPLDRGDDNFRSHADRKRHGDEPFLLWFLKQVRAHDSKAGRRTLDVLDVHYYPQGPGLYGGGVDGDAQARRLRATRSLWDPAYTDESWIGEPVRLVPRLKEWIATGYPGTKIGITEWNFGADNHINGALAIADVLGILGRENVYLANYWAHPPKTSPGYLAFKLFRNADNKNNGFGDVSCRAVSADPDRLSCFAATNTRSGDLTLVLVNKMPRANVTAPVQISGLPAGARRTLRHWRLSADAPTAIAAAGPASLRGPLTLTLPAQSITLVRIAASVKKASTTR